MLDSAAGRDKISIHTPVKGVTRCKICKIIRGIISIHTPVKGVTGDAVFDCLHHHISIHTPVKGVTQSSSEIFSQSTDFNPHTREGCDMRVWGCIHTLRNFNPHTREGCDW